MECPVDYDEKKQTVIVSVSEEEVGKQIRIYLNGKQEPEGNHVVERCFEFLNRAEIEFMLKDELYGLIKAGKSVPVLLAELHTRKLNADLFGALAEIITG